MSAFNLVVGALVVIFLLPSAAEPEPHGAVAAECIPEIISDGSSAAGFNDGEFRPGQTFVSQLSGVVYSIELGLFSLGFNDVVVELRSTVDGAPTSTILDSAVISGGWFSDDSLHTASFDPAVSLIAGTTYAIVLRALNTIPAVSVLGSFPACTANGTGLYFHSYDGGNTWKAWNDRSFVYRVNLVVPTPTIKVTWGSVKSHYR